jgi:hypothetical protein
MEPRFQITSNGQELQKDDVNLVAQEAALADDRVLAELLRLAPFDGQRVSRAIIPFGHAGASGATVSPNGPTGSVLISPFRAIIGSRTAVQNGAKDAWRDIRSAIFTAGPGALTSIVGLNPNPTATPRWDLICAAVAVDANGASTLRFAKDPATKVVNAQALVTTIATTITVSAIQGVAGASPTAPATPNDAGGTFYIPLAYVRVVPNFGSNTTLSPVDLCEVAPIARVSRVLGSSTLRPADVQFDPAGALLTAARFGDWGTTGARPPNAMPPSMSGGDSIALALTFIDPTIDRGWLPDGAILDRSVDWRNRLFRVHYQVRSWQAAFAWSRTASPWPVMPSSFRGSAQTPRIQNFDFGQSFVDDGALYGGFAGGAVFVADPTSIAFLAQGSRVAVYVDAATGAMKLALTGVPNALFLLWIEATAPFTNE